MKAQPKKVLFLITKSNWGGAQRYVHDLATHLDRTKYEPVVAAGGNGTLIEQLRHAGIRTITIHSLERDVSLKKEWAFARELWRLLREEQPAVLHVNSSKAGGIGCLLGRLRFVPAVVFTAHGWAFNEDRPTWQKYAVTLLHWVTVLLSHKTIAVSRAMVEQLNLPGTRRKMHVIHPGRTIGVMYSKSEARSHIVKQAPALAPHQHEPWLLTIGELHPIKRHTNLIQVLPQLLSTFPNLRLVIIGDGELRHTLAAEIRAAKLEQHAFLVGSITEAARFLRAADVFVLPSKSESYGYVLHEAGLAGIPVVASNVGGIPDIVINGASGRLVPPDDLPSLVSAISNTLKDTTTTEQYRAALQKSMSTRTVEHMTTETTRLYSSISTE